MDYSGKWLDKRISSYRNPKPVLPGEGEIVGKYQIQDDLEIRNRGFSPPAQIK